MRRYYRSGLCQVEFADQHQLGLSTLRSWIAQSPSAVGSTAEEPLAWQEVKVATPGGPMRWAAELVRPDGWVVRVAAEAPPAWVQALLRSAC